MEYNFSIIIPHKNVPDLLLRLLDSIPQRDDLEVIVVDDNSDNQETIKSSPVYNRANTSYIFLDKDQANGAGKARNIGMQYAKGRWLLFADADDFYTDKISHILDKYAHDSETEIVYLSTQYYYDNGNTAPLSSYNRYIQSYLAGKKYSEDILRYQMWSPWTRMVRKDIVDKHNLQFEEIPVGNDVMFSLQCSKFASSIKAETDIVYNYYAPDKGSVTCAYSKNVNNFRTKLELQLRQLNFYKNVNYKFKNSFLYFYLRYPADNKNTQTRKLLWDFIKKEKINMIADFYNMLKLIFARLLKTI